MLEYIDIISTFFFFLSKTEGVLFRLFIESFVLVGILYMLLSEYLRMRTRQTYWFSIMATLLVAARLPLVLIIALKVFGVGTFTFEQSLFPLFARVLEVLAVLALLRGLLYFSKKRLPKTEYIATGIIGLGIVLLPLWNSVRFTYNYGQFWGDVAFLIVELALFTLCIQALSQTKNPLARGFLPAVVLFAFGAALTLVNHLFYHGQQVQLEGISKPFILITTILFARAIYLTLANKLHLTSALSTSKKQYEEEKQLNMLKDSFVSTVSHELRTPLTTMKFYTGLMKDKHLGEVSDEQVDALNTINGEIDRQTQLINDLLDFSKFKEGKIELNITEFDMVDLIRNSPHNALGYDKNVLVNFLLPPKLVIQADKDRLHQLYINLLSNAVKFSPEGIPVTVKLWLEGEFFNLSVVNEGPKIPKEQLEKIFEPFFQGKHKKGGTGLGLSICKHIANMHNGDIELFSTKKETTAHVRIKGF